MSGGDAGMVGVGAEVSGDVELERCCWCCGWCGEVGAARFDRPAMAMADELANAARW